MSLNKKNIAIYIAIIAIVLSLPSTTFADTKFIEVEMKFDGTYTLVPVSVGGKNLMFVLDSAAGGSVISPATRNALGFTDKDGEMANIVGAGGNSSYQSLKIPQISIGGMIKKDFNVTVIDLKKFQKKEDDEPYAGILGNDFLRHFDLEINLPASKMLLYPHDENKQTVVSKLNNLRGISNHAESEGFIAFDVSVEGKPVKAILDTGAPTTFLNWQAAKQANVTPETKGLIRRGTAGGLGAQKAETYLYNFKNIKAGETSFDANELRIADLSIFKALGYGEKPAMIFGLDMLKNQVLFVSYSTKKIYFYQPDANSSATSNQQNKTTTDVTKPTAPAPRKTPQPLPADLVSFYEGEWTGEGKFANGREIKADVRFRAELDNQWLFYSHHDHAPNKYKALGMWGYELATENFVMIVQDNFGGSRRFQSEGWTNGKIVFTNRVVTAANPYDERFVFERQSNDTFKMTYEVSRDAKEWRMVDYLVFSRKSQLKTV